MRIIGWLALTLLALVLAAYFYLQRVRAGQELDLKKNELHESQLELSRNRAIIDSLVVLCQADTPTSFNRTPAPGPAARQAVARLRKKGFRNPEEELLLHLQQHPELVPAKGSLGGRMAFRELTLLTERYALGYFEDGHEAGYALLRFEAAAVGKISWQVADYYRL